MCSKNWKLYKTWKQKLKKLQESPRSPELGYAWFTINVGVCTVTAKMPVCSCVQARKPALINIARITNPKTTTLAVSFPVSHYLITLRFFTCLVINWTNDMTFSLEIFKISQIMCTIKISLIRGPESARQRLQYCIFIDFKVFPADQVIHTTPKQYSKR